MPNRTSATVTCANCQKEFSKSLYDINRKKTNLHYCSYACHGQAQRTQVEIACEVCARLFKIKPYRLRKGKVFCSYACKVAGLGGGSTLVYCDQCGEEIHRKNAEVKQHNFCSRPCMGKWQSEHIKGENSPSWRGGYQPYYGADWKTNRRLACERDGHICQACGSVDDLEVHHIKPVRLFPNTNDANGLTNLVTLCRFCHVKADVLARWVFDPLRRQSEAFHPLQNNISIARLYFTPETFTP
jgi:5-methylcytosine-specific restriction endonuclease McrA